MPTSKTEDKSLMTVGDLMRSDGVPRHAVEYAIDTYRIRET